MHKMFQDVSKMTKLVTKLESLKTNLDKFIQEYFHGGGGVCSKSFIKNLFSPYFSLRFKTLVYWKSS